MNFSDAVTSGTSAIVVTACVVVMAVMWHRLRANYGCRSPRAWWQAIKTQHPPRILSAFFWEAAGWCVQRGWFLVYRITDRPRWMVDWGWIVNSIATAAVVVGVILLFSIPGPGLWGRHWWKYLAAAFGAAFVAAIMLAWQV